MKTIRNVISLVAIALLLSLSLNVYASVDGVPTSTGGTCSGDIGGTFVPN